jgi:hypothetical protein
MRTDRAFHDGPPCVEPGGVDSPTGAQGRGAGLALARSIFDLELSAIGRRLRPAPTGQKLSFEQYV